MASKKSIIGRKTNVKENELGKLDLSVKNMEEREEIVNIFPRNWPEWSDGQINLEDWKIKSQHGSYLDPEGILLPHSVKLNVVSWKRPNEIFGNEITLYKDLNDFDMTSNNEHLMFSRFMRWIISSIDILKTIADENDFTVEGEHSQYDANLEEKWRPWHHIYSFCKAGKVPHTPIINPAGKYVVRLYYLGCWRKFLIDDLLPVDHNGRIMLPVSSNKGELWPMLLSKGLLKIASNFWNKRDDLSGFQPISCLTGWVCEEITNIEFDGKNLRLLIKHLLDKRECIQEKHHQREGKSDASSKIGSKSSNITSKEVSQSKQSKKIKQTEIIVTLKFWNEKLNGNEEFQKTFPSNEVDTQNTSCSLSKDPVIDMNFPALLCDLKEKEYIIDGIEDKPNEWGLKSNIEKCGSSTITFIKAYSNLLDIKDANQKEMKLEQKEKRMQKTKKKDSKSKTAKLPKNEASVAKEKLISTPSGYLQKYPAIGRWLTFDSLLKLLEGIVVVYKPSLFSTNLQKPDLMRYLSPKFQNKAQGTKNGNLNDKALFIKEGEIEEKFIFIDSPECSQLIISLDVLPILKKTENTIGLLCDLPVDAKEKINEKKSEYYSPALNLENSDSLQIFRKERRKSEKENEDKTSDKSMEFCKFSQWEIVEGNERYVCENALYKEIPEFSGSMDDNEDFKLDDYVFNMYEYQGTVKENDEEFECYTSAKSGSEEAKTLLDNESINSEELDYNVERLESYLLSHKIQKLKISELFNTVEELEEFKGECLLSHMSSQMSAGHLEIDFFEWPNRCFGQESLLYSVSNTKCVSIQLPSGRNILRVDIRASNFSSFHVLCTVEAVIHNLDFLFSEMTKDSKKIASYEENIHQSIQKAMEELNDCNYMAAVKKFWNSPLPENHHLLPKFLKELARQAFQESIQLLVLKNSDSINLKNTVSAFRVLFLNPCFGSFGENMGNSGPGEDLKTKTRSLEQNTFYSVSHSQAATKIQSFFRKIEYKSLMKSLRERRNQLAVHITPFMQSLKNNKNMSIIRIMLQRRPELQKLYNVQRDLKNEIDMYEWNGICMDVVIAHWIPLVRYSFLWAEEEVLKASIKVTCPIQSVAMTIINNDTGKMLPGSSGSYFMHHFQKNEQGYTLFAYGISENCNSSSVPWKVNHVVAKGSPPLQILSNGQPTETVNLPILRYDLLNGYYIPNTEGIICSFKMTITEPVVASLFFTTSEKSIHFHLELCGKEGLTVASDAKGMLTIPYLFLRGSSSGVEESPICFMGKVTLKGKWPLSEFQTRFSEMQWIKDTSINEVLGETLAQDRGNSVHLLQASLKGSNSRQEVSANEAEEESERPASWTLSVILDSPHRVVLKEVKKKAENIVKMKKQWEAANPGILKRNAEFFKKHKENNFSDCLKHFKEVATVPSHESPEKKEFKAYEGQDNDLQDINLAADRIGTSNEEVTGKFFDYIKKLIKSDFGPSNEPTDDVDDSEWKLNESRIEGFGNADFKQESMRKDTSSNSLISEDILEKLQERLNSLSEKQNISANSCDCEEIGKKISCIDLRSEVQESNDISLGEYLINYHESYPLLKNEKELEDNFEIKPCGHIIKGNETCPEVPLENKQDDDIIPPETSEKYNEGPSVITIDDWVNIQRSMMQRKEDFKKKILKVYDEEKSFIGTPIADHHEKWNNYLLEVMKINEDPFHDLEKFRKAYRHKMKKMRLEMKRNGKKASGQTKEIRGGVIKKEKSGAEDKVKVTKKETRK